MHAKFRYTFSFPSQQRNVELAALLEQRNERHDRAVATMSSLRDQLHRLQLSKEEEKRALEVSTQRELAKARDQVSSSDGNGFSAVDVAQIASG